MSHSVLCRMCGLRKPIPSAQGAGICILCLANNLDPVSSRPGKPTQGPTGANETRVRTSKPGSAPETRLAGHSQSIEEAPTDPEFVRGLNRDWSCLKDLERAVAFGDRYRLIELLDRGGMGYVLKAEDLKFSPPRVVAIKLINPKKVPGAEGRKWFAREIAAMAKIQHRNVVRIYDHGEIEEVPYFVMELLQGETLEDRLLQHPPLNPQEAIQIAFGIITGLIAAHEQGITHHDLKPANVWLESGLHPVILDFGLAKFRHTEGTGQEEPKGAGTPRFMPPEQHLGERGDVRSDLFSLGVILYLSLTGHHPYTPSDIRRFATAKEDSSLNTRRLEGLPRQLVRLLETLLSLDISGRPRDLQEVANRLRGILDSGVTLSTQLGIDTQLAPGGTEDTEFLHPDPAPSTFTPIPEISPDAPFEDSLRTLQKHLGYLTSLAGNFHNQKNKSQSSIHSFDSEFADLLQDRSIHFGLFGSRSSAKTSFLLSLYQRLPGVCDEKHTLHFPDDATNVHLQQYWDELLKTKNVGANPSALPEEIAFTLRDGKHNWDFKTYDFTGRYVEAMEEGPEKEVAEITHQLILNCDVLVCCHDWRDDSIESMVAMDKILLKGQVPRLNENSCFLLLLTKIDQKLTPKLLEELCVKNPTLREVIAHAEAHGKEAGHFRIMGVSPFGIDLEQQRPLTRADFAPIGMMKPLLAARDWKQAKEIELEKKRGDSNLQLREYDVTLDAVKTAVRDTRIEIGRLLQRRVSQLKSEMLDPKSEHDLEKVESWDNALRKCRRLARTYKVKKLEEKARSCRKVVELIHSWLQLKEEFQEATLMVEQGFRKPLFFWLFGTLSDCENCLKQVQSSANELQGEWKGITKFPSRGEWLRTTVLEDLTDLSTSCEAQIRQVQRGEEKRSLLLAMLLIVALFLLPSGIVYYWFFFGKS